MTHIHYKFSSSKLSYDTVVFDGPHITLTDLKRQIMGREKLRAADCDLQITNAQTKEEYTEGEGLIPKGSSVIVRRFPVIGVKSGSSSKTSNTQRSDLQAFGVSRAMSDQGSTKALSFFSRMQMANLVDADASEEDKIRVMINQSSINLNPKLGPALPENYTCYRCGNAGHHIRNCPVSGDKNFEGPPRIKKSTGIPRSFMVEVDDPNIKGVKLTNCGRYAIPAIDAEAYAIGKKEKPPFVQQERPKSESEEEPVPDELLCLICREMLGDAVVIPCCGNSYCDDCIRSALLDSEDHVCPTCGQSDVSPDTLIANKSLRQTVNNFKNEPDCSKSSRKGCVALNSKNSTPTPNPAVAPPPLSTKSQLHKSSCSQKDSLLNHPKGEKSPPASQSPDVPPEATEPAPAENSTNSSSQPAPNQAVTFNNEDEGDDSAAVAPPLLLSDKDPTDAPSQPEPQVHRTDVQTASTTQRDSSSDSALGLSGSSSSLDSTVCSSSSSFSCPTGILTEPTTEQHLRTTSSSSLLPSSFTLYPTTPPPLFPSPPVHTFIPTHQPHSSYPPRYPLTTTPTWKLPAPRGTPIPSLCSSTSTSSIPVLIPKEWYQYQKTERSPQRRSFSHSNSKTSKSKSSRSRSRSSSRSASRSRSRSRPCSPHSSHRNPHVRSNPSTSYGYKRPRSTTPSSSSSSRGAHSRSNSSSNHRKSRHHGKRSSSSSRGSKRRGDAGRSSCAQQTGDVSALELDRQRYLQWKKEYQEWYDKHFSSFINHFHQMPLPPPPPDPRDSFCPPQGRHASRIDGGSPSSETSSDSRSPPSHSSSSDAPSAASHPSSDSCLSFKANDGHSSPSHSSSDSRSTPPGDRAQARDVSETRSVTLTRSEDAKELKADDNQHILKRADDLNQLNREQKKKKKLEGRAKDLLSSDSSDSTGDVSRDKKRRHTGPNPRKEGSPVRHQSTAGDASVQPPLKKDTSTDKRTGKKVKEERNVKKEQMTKRGQDSDVRVNVERKDKVKPSKEPDRVETVRGEEPGGSNAPESRSEQNKKRKWGDKEKNDRKSDPKSSNCPKIKTTELESHEKKSLKPSDRKKQNPEKKEGERLSPSQRNIWEGGVKVIPQKKISININLCGKTKEKEPNSSNLEICTQETEEQAAVREQKVNKDGPETENRSPGNVTKEKPTSVLEEVKEMSNEVTPREGKHPGEKKECGENKGDKMDSDLWHCALTGEEEEERVTGQKETVTRGEPWREEEANSQSSKSPDDGRTKKPRNSSSWTGSWEAEEMKTLEESSQGRAEEAQSQPAQVSQSKWEKGGQSRAEKEIAGDAVILPQPSETQTKSEAAGKPEQKKQRSTDERRDGDRVTGRGRDKERRPTSSCSHWGVAPSGGGEQTDSSVCAERDRETKRDRERTREADRQKDGKRLKQRPPEERRRDLDTSVPKRNQSSSSSSSLASHDKDRRDWLREGEQDGSLSWKPVRGNTCPPDQNVPKTHRHVPPHSRAKTERDPVLHSNYHQRPSVSYRDKNRPARIQHSPPFVSHGYSEDRDLLLFESAEGPQRGFPDWGLTHESRAPRGERREAEQVPKTMRDYRTEREPPEAVAGRGGGGSRRDDRPRKLEERRRSSSDSVRSSSSHKSSKDDKREEEWKEKQKRHKKEKGDATSELLDVNV